MANQRLYALDAMRGIAAIAVVCLHAAQQLGSPEPRYSYLAVDFFFMLSGFVLTRAYELPLRQEISIFVFLRSRLIRLYPVFALGAALGVISILILIGSGDRQAPHVAGFLFAAGVNLLLLPDPVSLALFPVNPPGWSLFLEICANILFASVFFRLATPRLAAICALLAVALAYPIMQHASVSFGTQWSDAALGLLRTIYGFIVGMLVARYRANSSSRDSVRPLFLLLILIAILFAPDLGLPKGSYPAAAIFLILPFTLWLASKFEMPALFRPLSAALGDMSYPLYAVHFPLLVVFSKSMKAYAWPPAISASFFIIAICPLSWAIAIYFDLPVRVWLNRTLLKRRRYIDETLSLDRRQAESTGGAS